MKKVATTLLVLIFAVGFAGCANMSKRQQCIVKSTVAGAVFGGAAGAAAGEPGHSINRGEGAGIGVAAGGLIGGALGYIFCEAEELDSDGDGVPDSLDKCPNTPIGVEVDANGCPIDSDGDGVPDYLDKCPDTPRGVKVDEKGCPLDSDGDGVPDYLDKCPNTPKGCTVDKNGCPVDSDGDGVPDCIDNCPDTPKGSKVDDKGCPLVGEHLLILKGITFEFDSAKVSPESAGILARAVENMERNPTVKVLIEGHTCSTGPEDYNMGLSLRRAQAVKDFLVSKGVAADRMSVKGFGETEPIASNDTKEGRAENRRVEFVVLSK